MAQQILVVDDDDEIRLIIHTILEDAGYDVYEAPDGTPALERLGETAPPMVVLLDLLMPGMDGRRVLEAVAARDSLALRHVFLMLTATADMLPPALIPLLESLHVQVLAKPFDIEDLLASVAQAAQRLTRVQGATDAAPARRAPKPTTFSE